MKPKSFSIRPTIVVLALAVAASAFAAPPEKPAHKPFDPGAPYQAARSRTFHAIHYALTLSFDEPKGEVIGRDEITLEPLTDDFDTIELDCGDLTVEKATVSGIGDVPFQTGAEKLWITLPTVAPRGAPLTVSIRYHGFPHRGLTFVRPDKAYPDKVAEIWSQGESEDNHFWFPCYDYPNDRATSEVTATVPENQVCISNGELVGVESDSAHHTRTFHWKIDVPHSTYLTSIAVGPLKQYKDSWNGKPVEYWVAPSVDEATARRSYGLTPDMIDFFSKRTGVPYPYSKYAQDTMEEFGGGMENISATTQTDRTLHDARADLDYKSEGLVAHELAHQWFGDLVTCKDWADIWLNEGFATFWETLYTEHHDGEDAYRYELIRNARSAMTEDRERYRRPIVDHHYFSPDDMFDSTTYPKGGWVLQMLRAVLGDDAFFRGIHHYLEVNRAKAVDTHDFQKAMEEATGQSLDWFFNEWLYKGGYPEYKVSANWDPSSRMEKLTVEQTQSLDEVTPIFEMPVFVDFQTRSGHHTFRVMDGEKKQDFFFPLDGPPEMVRFDPHGDILKTLEFARSIADLAEQAEHDPDVAGRIWAVDQLGKEPGEPDALSALERVLDSDPFYGVRAEAAKQLGHFHSDASRGALIAALEQKKSDVRAAAAGALADFEKDTKAFAAEQKVLESDESYAAEAAAAEAIGKIHTTQSLDVLKQRLTRPVWRSVAQGVFRGLSDLDDPRALPIALEWSAWGKPEEVRPAAVALLGKLSKKEKKAYDRLVELLKDPSDFVRMGVCRGLGDSGREEAIAPLTRAEQSDTNFRVRRAAKRAIEALREKSPGPARSAEGGEELEQLKKENQELARRVERLEREVARARPEVAPAQKQ